jgi:hypothetical protein
MKKISFSALLSAAAISIIAVAPAMAEKCGKEPCPTPSPEPTSPDEGKKDSSRKFVQQTIKMIDHSYQGRDCDPRYERCY